VMLSREGGEGLGWGGEGRTAHSARGGVGSQGTLASKVKGGLVWASNTSPQSWICIL